jgi:hypothetical protein
MFFVATEWLCTIKHAAQGDLGPATALARSQRAVVSEVDRDHSVDRMAPVCHQTPDNGCPMPCSVTSRFPP